MKIPGLLFGHTKAATRGDSSFEAMERGVALQQRWSTFCEPPSVD